MNIKITNCGYYVPQQLETALEVSKKINKSEDWIISRTGVKERRISNIDVDKIIINIPRYIGFLEYLKIPDVTSLLTSSNWIGLTVVFDFMN